MYAKRKTSVRPEGKPAPTNDTGTETTKKTPAEEFNFIWRELVQNQRMFEMVKCLQHEKKKLKIMHANINFEVNEELLDFATKKVTDRNRASYDSKRPFSSGTTDDAPRGTPKDLEDDNDGSSRDNSHRSYSFMKVRSNSIRTSRSVGSEINSKNKVKITDQEFEAIIALCEDKIEQKALREAYEEKKAREKYLNNATEKRIMLYDFLNSRFITNFMLVTIITSIVGIFLLTFESIAIRYAWPLMFLDSCIMGIFLVEAILKVYIYTDDYFRQLWNILDLTIIIIHIMEVFIDLTTRTLALSTDINANIGFKFLKSLRALRLLRVIKFLPNLQVIVETVFQSMLSIGSIAVLMLLFIFVFAVMGRGLFYERSPDRFGNLWLTFVTLFQLLTLDDWFELLANKDTDTEEYENNIEETDVVGYWLMFFYLFAYLVMEFFVFLNLFVAVLVDNFQLTMADVEFQKQKEAQEERAAQMKFEEMKNEGIDPAIVEEEHLLHRKEVEQLGLLVDDYFPIDKASKEAQLLSEFFKDLNSLDLERFLWKRRQTLFNMITDTGLNTRNNMNTVREESETSSDDDEDDETHMVLKGKTPIYDDAKNVLKEAYLPSRYSFEYPDEDEFDNVAEVSRKASMIKK